MSFFIQFNDNCNDEVIANITSVNLSDNVAYSGYWQHIVLSVIPETKLGTTFLLVILLHKKQATVLEKLASFPGPMKVEDCHCVQNLRRMWFHSLKKSNDLICILCNV